MVALELELLWLALVGTVCIICAIAYQNQRVLCVGIAIELFVLGVFVIRGVLK